MIGERLDQYGAEFRLDRAQRDRLGEAQLRNARRDVLCVVGLNVRTSTIDFDDGRGAARLSEGEDILASNSACMAPDRIARRVEFRDRHRERPKRPVDLHPLGGRRGLSHDRAARG